MKRTYHIVLIVVAICNLLAIGSGWIEARGLAGDSKNDVVPYAHIFKEQAPLVGWDWQLLAAIAWHESRFNPYAHSYAGACGVMQLMPQTAHSFGLDEKTIWQPEQNIKAGVQYLLLLEQKWDFITNDEERTKFVLASYNAGHGNVFKARRLAKEAGMNPYRWGEVEPFMNQRTTKRYVNQVIQTANKYRQ